MAVKKNAPANLKEEIGLAREFVSPDEEVFLSYVYTWQVLQKAGYAFFRGFGVSDAQFNVLMILHDYRNRPLYQNELARLIVVNRASIGSLIDRMEAGGLVERAPDGKDRRANRVHITAKGTALLKKIKGPWYTLQSRLFTTYSAGEKKAFLRSLDKFRAGVRAVAGMLDGSRQKRDEG
jgi:DNA-binding MarR family transcriptional regulator